MVRIYYKQSLNSFLNKTNLRNVMIKDDEQNKSFDDSTMTTQQKTKLDKIMASYGFEKV